MHMSGLFYVGKHCDLSEKIKDHHIEYYINKITHCIMGIMIK